MTVRKSWDKKIKVMAKTRKHRPVPAFVVMRWIKTRTRRRPYNPKRWS